MPVPYSLNLPHSYLFNSASNTSSLRQGEFSKHQCTCSHSSLELRFGSQDSTYSAFLIITCERISLRRVSGCPHACTYFTANYALHIPSSLLGHALTPRFLSVLQHTHPTCNFPLHLPSTFMSCRRNGSTQSSSQYINSPLFWEVVLTYYRCSTGI